MTLRHQLPAARAGSPCRRVGVVLELERVQETQDVRAVLDVPETTPTLAITPGSRLRRQERSTHLFPSHQEDATSNRTGVGEALQGCPTE